MKGWCECVREKYPAQVARVWALVLLRDLPHLNNDVSTIDFCLRELKKTAPRALRRPLSKEEIAGVQALIVATAAKWKKDDAKWKAKFASEQFAQATCGDTTA